MTPEALAAIREWDAKCGENELVFFGTTLDRRRLLEYVDELTLRVADLERQLDDPSMPAVHIRTSSGL